MKKMLLFATSYPYATAIIAVVWLGSVILVNLNQSLSLSTVLVTNAIMTVIIAGIGFRK